MHKYGVRLLPLLLLLFARADVVSATTFTYAIMCFPTTIGPDTIGATFSQGIMNLQPNVATVIAAIDFYNPNTTVVALGHGATFSGTLGCGLRFNETLVSITRAVTLTVTSGSVLGNRRGRQGIISGETHSFSFAALSFTVNLVPPFAGAPQGTIAGGQGIRTDSISGVSGTQSFTPPPVGFTLLFTPPPPITIPLPPSLILTLTGIAGVGIYEARRRRMLVLRG